MDKLFSIAEAAGILGVCTKSVRVWCGQGRIVGVRLGARWRVAAEELERVRKEGVRRAEVRHGADAP